MTCTTPWTAPALRLYSWTASSTSASLRQRPNRCSVLSPPTSAGLSPTSPAASMTLAAGIVRREMVDFPINDVLEQLRTQFSFHAAAHRLGWRVVPSSLSVRSDPRLLEQMIRNLLSNAVKYTNKGKILLGCRRRGSKLRIEVWDTGIGVPEEQLQAIFEEFHQLDNPAREHSKGLGLGLTIVERLADLLGLSVDVRSRPGKGSVFAVEVPLGQHASQWRPREIRHEATEGAHRAGAILVVEDDPSVREMLALLLEGEGHRTAIA